MAEPEVTATAPDPVEELLADELLVEAPLVEELLVEEVSIDGMCGVY